MSGRLERHFLSNVLTLPDDTQTVLAPRGGRRLGRCNDPLACCASDRRAVERSGRRGDAGLLTIGTDIEFRHPLIRSAILSGADAAERRAVHDALATVSDGEADADQRAWHLAAATIGTDEAVAARARTRCGSAQPSRGHYAAEAAFYERAAALTSESRPASRALARGCASARYGGRPRRRGDRVARSEAAPDRACVASASAAARGGFAVVHASERDPGHPARTPRALEPLDARLARDTYAEAIEAVLVSGQLTKDTTPVEIAHAALAAPPRPGFGADGCRHHGRRLQHTIRCRVRGGRADPPSCASPNSAATPFEAPGISRGSTLGSNAAAELWDADGYGALLHALEVTERERGALDSLRITLGGLGHYDMWTGRFRAAEDRHSEAVEISRALGADPRVWELLKVELFAWQGRDAETRAAVAALDRCRSSARAVPASP